jgi:hypothetical protein
MHAHSLIWFALLVAAAAAFYRRTLGATWLAGLAACFFAIDDAHAIAATWIASRNILLGTLFAILALIAHDRWRRDGSRVGAVAAPLCLLVGLLGGEGALGAGGYLLAYALFLDRGTARARLASVLPGVAVIVTWYAVYAGLGYGAFGSGVYIDPGHEPGRFAAALLERAPLQLLAQWAFPPTDMWVWFSADLARGIWLGSVALLALLAAMLGPLLRVDRRARFFAVGMLLALVPNCTTIPNDRLLILVGLGAMGLLAQLIGALGEHAAFLPRSRIWLAPARVFGVVLILIHGVAAPVFLVGRTVGHRDQGGLLQELAGFLPEDAAVAERRLVMVNAPSALWGPFVRIAGQESGRVLPGRIRLLATGVRPLSIRRSDAQTLVIRPAGGYLAPARTPPQDTCESVPPISLAYLLQRADLVFRGEGYPVRLGERVRLTGLAIEVTEVTGDGRPAEAAFRFDVALDAPALLWLRWTADGCAPFEVPPVGQTVALPGLYAQGAAPDGQVNP